MVSALEIIAEKIKMGEARNIVILAGAGISTASGIPDFRSPRTGLYDNLKQYKLPFPEAIFDIGFFRRRPLAFYTLAKELYPTGRYRPNIAHYFFRLLHEKKLLRRIYTQNIDGLERVAGVPSPKLIEAHGTFATARCLKCRRFVNTKIVKAAIDKCKVARCPKCKGLVKPDIVFFDENLPQRFWRYPKDLPQSDLVLVMGTSLEVQPFSDVVFAVKSGTTRVLMNKVPVGLFQYGGNGKTDFVALGEISDLVKRLCSLLGWQHELAELMHMAEKHQIDYICVKPKKKIIEGNSNARTPDIPGEYEDCHSHPLPKNYTNKNLRTRMSFKSKCSRNALSSFSENDECAMTATSLPIIKHFKRKKCHSLSICAKDVWQQSHEQSSEDCYPKETCSLAVDDTEDTTLISALLEMHIGNEHLPI